MAFSYLIIWISIVVLIAGIHLYIIKGRKVSPNKALWLGIRIAIACVIGYLDWRQGVRPLELIVVSYFFSGWFLHNSILGWRLHGMPWYTNKT